MKRIFAMLLALCMIACLCACTPVENTTTEPTATEPVATEDTKGEGVMTYAEFAAAELNSQVVIETYVQGKQGWWTDDAGVSKATFYTQDKDGGYLLYNLPCTEAEYNQMVPGTKLKVTGYKAEWSGEVEIIDATFEILSGSYVAEATDVTALLGTDALAEKMNMFVSFKGMTVEACNDAGDAFMYNWDGSGAEGNDLYFKVSVNGATYTFCVESYLCGSGSAAYEAVKALKVGDKVNLEGFLYWYEGAQPHITAVSAAQ